MDEECCRRTFRDSLKDSARRVLENPQIVPRKVRKRRLDICHSCDRYIEDSDQCSICLCILGIKASFANMKCPIDKWMEYKGPAEEEEDGEG